MKKLLKNVSVLLCAVLLAPLFTVTATATPTSPSGTTAVYVRVESSLPGEEGTLLSRTEVLFNDNETHTALEALQKAVEGKLTTETGEYGTYVTSVYDIADETGQMSWLYAVNDELPWVGADAYELQYRDEVVFYFTDWQAASYAYFTDSAITVLSGQPFTLTLMGNHFSDGLFPVAAAELFINTDAAVPMTMNIHYTDDNGQVELAFYAPATYTISARKSEPDGASVISRPLCTVTVLPEDAYTITVNGIPVQVMEKPSTPTLTINPEISITPPLYQFPNVYIYDPETSELQINGHVITLTGALTPVLEDDVLLLPFRAIAEMIGAEVTWDAANGTATARLGENEISFKTSDVIFGKQVKIVDGRAYVPISMFIEPFGLGALLIEKAE